MGGKNNNQKTGLLLSCWILLALLLVIFFFVKKDAIFSNLKQTNFFERVGSKTPEFIENYKEPEKPKDSNGAIEIEITPGPAEIGSLTEVNNVEQDSGVQEIEIEKQIPAEEKKPEKEEKKQASEPVQKTKVNLCFVYVDSDGKVVRKIAPREIEKSNAPLTNTIRSLLDGPTQKDKNCMTLIPEGTRLLGASVKNGIATLNFSQEFEFGGINADSYRAQLMQIVYTATEFSTVDSVQFLIEGQRKEYMGSEELQIWIGSPYSRNNFR
ncbi:GerMN domain-containing protein [Treponema sp.]|uniref:GerMN domain-containing protein n=1 Tax=Treponema sp. TaxID=166 RepID=UPI00298DC351|nr:GerMN domain-containing protein [Treponema sp.]MCR5613853.1 GerMN domain-containing protein [Treponema sp.]